MKAIFVIAGNGFPQYQAQTLMFPLLKYKRELKQKYDFTFEVAEIHRDMDPTDLHVMARTISSYDAVFVQGRPFKVHGEPFTREYILEFLNAISATKVFFDDGDSSCHLDEKVMEKVDVYLKRQVLKERSDYGTSHLERTPWSDCFVRLYDYHGPIMQSPAVSDSDVDKLHLGWNIGLGRDTYQLLMKRHWWGIFKDNGRSIDVHLRARIHGDFETRAWIHEHRKSMYDKVHELQVKHNVVSSDMRVPLAHYRKELQNSAIALSPFGWGEISRNDFEIIIAECLLMKPSLAHLRTEPNIFVEYETYVPLEWDLSDLQEKCEYYLSHPEERERIAKAAKRRYVEYYSNKLFIRRFGEIVNRLCLLTEAGSRPTTRNEVP
ncbi:glycosyltransferase [Candidatus Methylomirabilis sp.]|uniref:glycosyltransferase n=1 Tax=Candidatus Methylomirabilis sp. TaxID=2032687 RepID=UPI0030764366